MFTEKEVIGLGINVYKNALPKELNLVNRFENALGNNSQYSWSAAKVGYSSEDLQSRNCQDFKYKKEHVEGIDEYSKDLTLMHDQISQSLKECLDDYARDYGRTVSYQEAINVVKYGPGHFFKHHSDDGQPYRCTISAVGYINDNFTGGELDFMYAKVTYKPNAGDFVICPSAFIYSHASLPVIEGTKYSLVIMNDIDEYSHIKDSPIYEYRK
jgi:hypothetical protein